MGHLEVGCKPLGTGQQADRLLLGEVVQGAIQGAVGEEGGEGGLALGAPCLLLDHLPAQDACGCRPNT